MLARVAFRFKVTSEKYTEFVIVFVMDDLPCQYVAELVPVYEPVLLRLPRLYPYASTSFA